MNYGVISQVRIALSNPIALLVGALLGGFVPLATYYVAHVEVKGYDAYLALVIGGLVYSAKTVWQWGRQAFQCAWKAAGFVLLVEGVMVLSHIPWLGVVALSYLIAINATATGCTLALRDKPARGRPIKELEGQVKASKAGKQPKRRQARTGDFPIAN